MNSLPELERKDVIEFVTQTGSYQGRTTLDYCTIIGHVSVEDIHITSGLLFSNCVFKHGVTFRNLKLSNELVFENCIFENKLDFSHIEKYEDVNVDSSGIRINSGKIEGLLSFKNLKIKVLDVQAIEKIEVINLEYSKIENVRFYNISNIGSCSFININIENDIELIRCSILHNFHGINSRIGTFDLNSCVFNIPITLMADFVTFSFNVFECDFNEYFFMYSPQYKRELNGKMKIVRSRFKKDFSYNYEEEKGLFFCHQSFYFQENSVNDNFSITNLDGIIKGVEKVNFLLKEFLLYIDNKSDSLYKLQNLNFEKISVSGNNAKSAIQLQNVNCQELHFKNLINTGNISIVNCFNGNGKYSFDKFKISRSLINNLTMLNIDLNKFKSIEISESSLNGLKANNTNFFDFNKLNGTGNYQKRGLLIRLIRWICFMVFNSKNENEIIFWENKREVYKQLKLSMDQNGDRINSLKFKAFEMKAYRKYLVLTKRIFNPDRIILGLSSINDFGLNWLKAFILCVIAMFSLYVALLVQINPILEFNLNWNNFDYTIETIIENLNIFFQLLNPIHDIKKVYEGFEITNLTYLIDYFSRITMSFFIFQIVSAFRKYIK
jgi:hypothetical protein